MTLAPAHVLCRDVKAIVEGPPLRLLEAVAHRAVSTVLERHAAVQQVDFSIRKLSIPGVPSVVESVGEWAMRHYMNDVGFGQGVDTVMGS